MDFAQVFVTHFFIAFLMYAVGYIVGRKRRVKNIDYKERWQKAIELLQGEALITEEQAKAISSEQMPLPKTERETLVDYIERTPRPPKAALRPSHPRPRHSDNDVLNNPPWRQGDTIRTPRHIRDMAFWDREKLAKQRAKAGLPPNDDLDGLPTWSILEIEKARMEAGQG